MPFIDTYEYCQFLLLIILLVHFASSTPCKGAHSAAHSEHFLHTVERSSTPSIGGGGCLSFILVFTLPKFLPSHSISFSLPNPIPLLFLFKIIPANWTLTWYGACAKNIFWPASHELVVKIVHLLHSFTLDSILPTISSSPLKHYLTFCYIHFWLSFTYHSWFIETFN